MAWCFEFEGDENYAAYADEKKYAGRVLDWVVKLSRNNKNWIFDKKNEQKGI